MSRILFIISSMCFLLSTLGCSSSTLRVESTPDGADVYAQVPGQTRKKIGQTPLNINESTVGSNQDAFQISITKNGYSTESVLVPPTIFSRSSSIQAQLVESNSASKTLSDQALQSVARSVALAQSYIMSKDYSMAEQILIQASSQYPGVATLQELLGNVYYLKRDLSKALTYYKQAYDMNPSTDTQRMINKIHGIQSFRAPSSGVSQ